MSEKRSRNTITGRGLPKRATAIFIAAGVAGSVAVSGMPTASALVTNEGAYFEKTGNDGRYIGGSKWKVEINHVVERHEEGEPVGGRLEKTVYYIVDNEQGLSFETFEDEEAFIIENFGEEPLNIEDWNRTETLTTTVNGRDYVYDEKSFTSTIAPDIASAPGEIAVKRINGRGVQYTNGPERIDYNGSVSGYEIHDTEMFITEVGNPNGFDNCGSERVGARLVYNEQTKTIEVAETFGNTAPLVNPGKIKELAPKDDNPYENMRAVIANFQNCAIPTPPVTITENVPVPTTVTETVTPEPVVTTETKTETVTPEPTTVTKTPETVVKTETATATTTVTGDTVTKTLEPSTVTKTETPEKETVTRTVTAEPSTVTKQVETTVNNTVTETPQVVTETKSVPTTVVSTKNVPTTVNNTVTETPQVVTETKSVPTTVVEKTTETKNVPTTVNNTVTETPQVVTETVTATPDKITERVTTTTTLPKETVTKNVPTTVNNTVTETPQVVTETKSVPTTVVSTKNVPTTVTETPEAKTEVKEVPTTIVSTKNVPTTVNNTVTETPQVVTETKSVPTTVVSTKNVPTTVVNNGTETVTLPAKTVTETPRKVTETVTKPKETVTETKTEKAPVVTETAPGKTKEVTITEKPSAAPAVTVTEKHESTVAEQAPGEKATTVVVETKGGSSEAEEPKKGNAPKLVPAPQSEPNLGSLSGTVVWDKDRSSNVNDGDERIEGLSVIISRDGKKAARATTDENGFYRFDNLEPGDYEIEVLGPDGGKLFFKDGASTVVAGHEDTGNDWGYVKGGAVINLGGQGTSRGALATTGANVGALFALIGLLATLSVAGIAMRRRVG